MKKIEFITRPEKLEDVKELVSTYVSIGMTVSMISGCGNQCGRIEVARGLEYTLNLLPKVKIEIVVEDEQAEGLINQLSSAVWTGEIGDGKVFVIDISNAITIRTGEMGVLSNKV